jgi:hypothetical protein
MNTETKNSTLRAYIPLPPLPEFLPTLPDQPLPPTIPSSESLLLPTPIPQPWPWPTIRWLRQGCYLLNYKPKASPFYVTYDGTLRVEAHQNGRTASGDLYQRPFSWICRPGWPPICFPVLLPGPDPANGIPVLPRDRYRYYLRVTQILEWFTVGNSFTLGFEMYRFDKASGPWSAGGTWTNEGTFTAQMTWTPAPVSYPLSGAYLEGDVKDSAGAVVGKLTMGWVSEYLRKATIEIDRVSASEVPLNNGSAVNWRTILDQVGWDATVVESNSNVPEPSGEGWSDAECHQGMLDWRDSTDLDTQWRYHLLCVRRLDSTERGIMYDAYGGDSNNIPREGAAISSHWVIPNADPWGKSKGMRFGTATAPYFRTAAHEIGHAMLQYHPSSTSGNHIMQVTPQIAANAVPPQQFPDNIEWAFSLEDQKALRHLPDIHVRPGGLVFGEAHTPISPDDRDIQATGLELKVAALLNAVPVGAPVRANLTLSNTTKEPLPVPASLSLKTGQITGQVIDQSGIVRTFSTIVRHLDEVNLRVLEPGKSMSHSLTLLRGSQGALFPSSGIYQIVVSVTWDVNGYPIRVSGETTVMVTPPVDVAHAEAAMKILSTPDALLTLVLGGDHLKEGIAAIHTALKNPVLRPHFAYIEAKRLAQRFGKRKANLKAASELIDESTIMSPAEIKKAATLVKLEGSDRAAGENITKTLKSKVKGLDVSDEIKDMVDSL